ncbi:copper-binding protein (plasmid) [Azospirillum oryzae]|uniref:Copper-binding protein n=1 Tax=Azospirillum oryzae TaxID=286727 RepID=A0A6N1ASN5_9PROT|nr:MULTISPECIES: copper-binding protein [Azospirillum]QKS54560.1 copper-binding protein [Azospirillum oryzae]GLR77422.1 hypothetical protein GCM10007856_00900 [Azospirillum oryzae]
MLRKLTVAALLTTISIAPAAWAQMDHPGHATPVAQPAAGTTGTVNAVDPAKRLVNLSHGTIAALSWPAMTMDFMVAPGVDLKPVKPGDPVAFTVGKDAAGMYRIETLTPVK